jgi:hypothetical protein
MPRNRVARSVISGNGTYATFPDGRRKAGIGPKPDTARLLSVLVYEFTPSALTALSRSLIDKVFFA